MVVTREMIITVGKEKAYFCCTQSCFPQIVFESHNFLDLFKYRKTVFGWNDPNKHELINTRSQWQGVPSNIALFCFESQVSKAENHSFEFKHYILQKNYYY